MYVFSKFCEILRHKTQNMRFAQFNISILQENATVDFSNVLLKIIRVLHVHRRYIQIHPQPSLFCKNENFVPFHSLTISKFTYH